MNKKYIDLITDLCKQIHIGIVDFDSPVELIRIPTQASSEFITNKQQGDWAEMVIFEAVNSKSTNLKAVRYGKSDDIIAGEAGFKEFYEEYRKELQTYGKRPDLLLFDINDYRPELGLDISHLPLSETKDYVTKAIAGIEVRSSAFLLQRYNDYKDSILRTNLHNLFKLRDVIIDKYADQLGEKRPELLKIITQLNESNVASVDFKVPSWRSSADLIHLSDLLRNIKECLKIAQKRNSLSFTPKAEDLKNVKKWISTFGVPHFYVQVFFDMIYGISFESILTMLTDSAQEDKNYYIEQDSKNQNKTTIKIPVEIGKCIAGTVTEPIHKSIRKELPMGRLLYYITFDKGEAFLDKYQFNSLFRTEL